MSNFLNISSRAQQVGKEAEKLIEPYLASVREISDINTQKVLAAFQEMRVSEACFAATTGYGYDDRGRDILDKVYARVFGAEDALVRFSFVNGTHAISCALFALLRPGDKLISAIGSPYDTLRGVIGISGSSAGTLLNYGVTYSQVEPGADGLPDINAVTEAVTDSRVKAVLIQRSRGYSTRAPLSVARIGELIEAIKKANPNAAVIVDNCYGEFVEAIEPTQVGADLVAGSLIKNPGGGLAQTGGYIAGRHECVEAAAMRLTAPGIGRECGSNPFGYRLLYQGLFMAPHTVLQAVSTAAFCAAVMELMGYKTSPRYNEARRDIIQMIEFGAEEPLKLFCKGIQRGAPVDSFVDPEPWDMPGYDCKVIMAAGAFVSGASIELSADAPMRPPYVAYMQGGLTYESGKAGILLAVDELIKGNL